MNPSFRTFVADYERFSYFHQRTTPLRQRDFYLHSILVPGLIGLAILVLFGWMTGLLDNLLYVYHAWNVVVLLVVTIAILSALRQGEPHHRVARRQEEWYWLLWWFDRLAWIWLMITFIGNIDALYGLSGTIEFSVLTIYLIGSWWVKRQLPDPRYLVGTALLALGSLLLLEAWTPLLQYGLTWVLVIGVTAWRRVYRWRHVHYQRYRIAKVLIAISMVLYVVLVDSAVYGFTSDAPNGLRWTRIEGISYNDYRILHADSRFVYATEQEDATSWVVLDTQGQEQLRRTIPGDVQYTIMHDTPGGLFLYAVLPEERMATYQVQDDLAWIDLGITVSDYEILNGVPSTPHPGGRIVDMDQGILVVLDEEDERVHLYEEGSTTVLCELPGSLDGLSVGYGSSVYFHHFHVIEDGYLLASTYQNEPYLLVLDTDCQPISDSGAVIPPPSLWATLQNDIRAYGGMDPVQAMYRPEDSEQTHMILDGMVYRIDWWYQDNLRVGYPLGNRMEAGVLVMLVAVALPHPFSEPKKG